MRYWVVLGLLLLICGAIFFLSITEWDSKDINFTVDGFEPSANIVLITVDTLRPDHLGVYGYGRDTSPFFDSLEIEGVVLDNMFAVRGSTFPSLTSMHTSLYPISTGVRRNGEIKPEGIPTISKILNNNGYTTGAFVSYFCKGITRDYGYDYVRCPKGYEKYTDIDLFTDEGKSDGVIQNMRDYSIVVNASDWILKHGDSPFFVWIHLSSPHFPYGSISKFDTFKDTGYKGLATGELSFLKSVNVGKSALSEEDLNHILSLYDGDISFTDGLIGNFYKTLEKEGVWDNTLFIISADHGEDFYERGYIGHACSIYDESLNIPLIMRFPKREFDGTRLDNILENIDIPPTILEYIGLKPNVVFQGDSFMPLIEGEYYPEKLALSEKVHFDKDMFVLTSRSKEWRYIYNPDIRKTVCESADLYIDKEELYNVVDNPAQTKDKSSENLDIVKNLRSEMLSTYPNMTGYGSVKIIDEEGLDQLRQLGYIV